MILWRMGEVVNRVFSGTVICEINAKVGLVAAISTASFADDRLISSRSGEMILRESLRKVQLTTDRC